MSESLLGSLSQGRCLGEIRDRQFSSVGGNRLSFYLKCWGGSELPTLGGANAVAVGDISVESPTPGILLFSLYFSFSPGKKNAV